MWHENVLLRDHTTLKVGGPAEFFLSIRTESELLAAVQEAKERALPWRVIAGGSNILVPDRGLPGLTIHIAITGWTEQPHEAGVAVTVGAGETLDTVIEQSVRKEYWGLENLSHIPGSVGATPVQNVGAYGVETADVLTAVRALNTKTLEWVTLDNAACRFAYRDSIFKHDLGRPYIITAVTYQLSVVADPQLSYKDLKQHFAGVDIPSQRDIRAAVIAIRAKKFPDWRTVGTAGSFFKNPIVPHAVYERLQGEYPGLPGFNLSDNEVKIPLAWVLDNVCGLRGVTKGNVGTYAGQALVLVHDGSANATEIVAFAEDIAASVFAKTGIAIEWEVTRLG